MNEDIGAVIIQTILPLIASALGTVLIAATTYYANYFRQKAQSEKINRYIEQLESTVYDVVMSLNQTTVEKLKEASADGKLTPEEIDVIKSDARDTITKIIGVTGMNLLGLVFEDVDALIASKIERTVKEVKVE